MADKIYAKQAKTCQEFVWDLARFLMDDLAGHNGPDTGWSLIDTYGQAAATDHEVPSTATDMDSLAADNPWRTGSGDLTVGDYVVLENSAAGQKFQLGIEWHATDQVKFILAFTGGWVTGNNNADMTAASNWGNAVSSTVTFDPNNTTNVGNYSIWADEDHVKLFYEDGVASHMNFLYAGNYEDPLDGDTNKSVIYTAPTTCGVQSSGGIGSSSAFRKLSPVNDTTVVNAACITHAFATQNLSDSLNLSQDSDTSKWRKLDLLIASNTAGHIGTWGKLKNVWYLNENVTGGGQVTFDSQNYIAFSESGSHGKIVCQWDGSTNY